MRMNKCTALGQEMRPTPSMRKPVVVKSLISIPAISFQEKAGRCQELISIPAISFYKDHLRHRAGASPGRVKRAVGQPGRVVVIQIIREGGNGRLLLVPSLFFVFKITASVAILPSALLNEPFGAPCQLGVLVSVGAVHLDVDLDLPSCPGSRI
jgi:hypothetical protein